MTEQLETTTDVLLPDDIGAADDVEPDDDAVPGEFVASDVQDDEATIDVTGADGDDPATDDADEGSDLR